MWPARSCVFFGISVALLSWAPTAIALTYVSNLAEAYTVGFSAAPPPNFSTASSFTTDGGSYTLNRLTLKIQSNNSSSSVGVRLRADNGGHPGVLLEDLGINPLPLGASLQSFPSTGTILAANTTYWVTCGETGSGFPQWAGTSSTAQTSPSGWTIGDQSFNTTDGANWNPISFGPPTEAGLFSVDATSLSCVSNLAEAYTVGFSAAPPPNFSTASSFTTGAGSSSLNSLTLKIQSNNSSSSVGVRLRADNGGHPGVLLEDLGINLLPGGSSLQTFASTGTILAANTTYWVTCGEAGSGFPQWEGTSSTAQTSPSGWTIGDQSFNTTDGANWNPISFGPPTEAGLFSVNASCSGTVDVGGPSAPPKALELSAAVPNPFRLRTRIDYVLAVAGHVTLTVHDLQGRRVATLTDGEAQAGRHSSTWDGHTEGGGEARAGIYFVRLAARSAAGTEASLRTIVMLR